MMARKYVSTPPTFRRLPLVTAIRINSPPRDRDPPLRPEPGRLSFRAIRNKGR
jgi:hypothetical protein